MTVQIAALGRTALLIEGTFATAEAVGNFTDLPVVEGSSTFVGLQEHLEPQVMQQFVHDFRDSKMVLGKKSSTLALTSYLAGTGAPVNGLSAVPYLTTTWAQYLLLKTLMGGAYQGSTALNALTVTTGVPTTTNVPITTNHGTNFALAGSAYAVVLPNGTIEAREILSFSASAVVPKVAHSVAPATGAQVYWPTTFYLVEGTSANLGSLQFLCEGVEAGDEFSLYGGQGTLAVDITTGQIAKMSVQIQGASWARSTLRTFTAPTSIPGFSPISNVASELIIGSGAAGVSLVNAAAQTRNLVPHSQSTWTPGMAVTPITSPEGLLSSNCIGYKRARGRAITGSFVTYGDDGNATATWHGADANRYDYSINQQIGMTTAGIVLLTAPTVQISAAPARSDANGLYGLTVNWAGRNDAAVTRDDAATTAAAVGRSAFRIHVW